MLLSRTSPLFDDVTTWKDTIRRAWRDQLINGAPITFHMVDPAPPHLKHGTTAHVIVMQFPHDHYVTSLVCIYDQQRHPGIGPLLRSAIITVEHIHREHVVQQAGYGELCLLPGAPPMSHMVGNCSNYLRPAHHGTHCSTGITSQSAPTGELVAHDHRPRVCPRVINLEQLIELQTIVSIDFRPVIALWHQLFEADLGPVLFEDGVVKWHPATRAAFAFTSWHMKFQLVSLH